MVEQTWQGIASRAWTSRTRTETVALISRNAQFERGEFGLSRRLENVGIFSRVGSENRKQIAMRKLRLHENLEMRSS
jgi:hypothetical protein